MFSLAAYLRNREKRPYVRPWALATPIAVLLVCLPLLRPLHHPGQASVDEELRLATISALVENPPIPDSTLASRLAIDKRRAFPHAHVITVNRQFYSDQPPMLAFLLSGPYRILYAMGYRLHDYSVLVPYLLTLLGATLPAAACAGLIYRMGRIFELHRRWRAGLAAAVVFGTGLISYAVVLNAHVPAAFLVLSSAGCLVHVAASKTPARGGGWLMLAGFCAALAATIDLAAAFFVLPMLVVIGVVHLRPALRVGGMVLYVIGAMIPIMLHAALTIPTTGNILPGSMHPELAAHFVMPGPIDQLDSASDPALDDSADDDPSDSTGILQSTWRFISRVFSSLLGTHGLLVHFPVVIIGFTGMLAVMHRHWPATTKTLAAISATAIIIELLAFSFSHQSATAGFANRWLIVFLPMLLFWAGAWLRRKHHPVVWTAVGVLLAFSVTVSLIGATDPLPRTGYDRYTVAGAVHNMLYPPSPISPTALAGG
jgi:hypothetical protein